WEREPPKARRRKRGAPRRHCRTRAGKASRSRPARALRFPPEAKRGEQRSPPRVLRKARQPSRRRTRRRGGLREPRATTGGGRGRGAAGGSRAVSKLRRAPARPRSENAPAREKSPPMARGAPRARCRKSEDPTAKRIPTSARRTPGAAARTPRGARQIAPRGAVRSRIRVSGAVLRGPPRTGIIRSRDPGGDSKSFSRREMSDGRSAAETGCESPPRRPVKIASPFFARVKGVNVRASGPRERRRILRERHAAFQEKVREIGNSLGTEEASALRKAERQA